MKINSILLLLSISLLFLATSCKKDVEDIIEDNPTPDPEPTTYFEFEGEKYEITQCFSEFNSFGGSSITDEFTIKLVPEGVIYDTWIKAVVGNGDGVILNIAVANGTNFPTNNTFVIDSLNNNIEPWELWASKVLLDGDFFMSSGTEFRFKSGQCTISNSTTYGHIKVVGNFKTDDGKSVTIDFEGPNMVF